MESEASIQHFRSIGIRDDLKKVKDLIPSQEPGVEGDATSQPTHYCSEHADREPELYCETCNELICYKCIAKGSKHHAHDYDPLDEAFDKYKGEITSSLEPIEKQLKTIHTALAELDFYFCIWPYGLWPAGYSHSARDVHMLLSGKKSMLTFCR